MGAPQSNLPQHLRTFVEPQIEQFSLRMEPVAAVCTRRFRNRSARDSSGRRHSARTALSACTRCGLRNRSSSRSARRTSPASSPDRAQRSNRCRTCPPRHPPSARTSRRSPQAGGTTRCLMQEGVLYESTSITYTPGYFDGMRKRFPDDFRDVEATIRAGRRREPSRRDALHPEIVHPPSGHRCPEPRRTSTRRRSKR